MMNALNRPTESLRQMIKGLRRQAPSPPDTTAEDQLTREQNQLATAQTTYQDTAAAIARCEVDIAAARDAETELHQLERQRTDLRAAAYIENTVADTKALDMRIANKQMDLATLKAKADGAVAARPVLMAKLVQHRVTMEAMQDVVTNHVRVMTGRPMTAAEVERYEKSVNEQMARRKAEQAAGTQQERDAEVQREERERVEVERQKRQGTHRDRP
jgi:uncharacterized DUF497 family protein